jgi:PadR family transcriptional regulator PadR
MEGLGVAQRDPSAIYRSLYLLERWGLVSSAWDVEAGGRPRRVYTITEEGEEALGGWMEDIRRQKQLIERLLEEYGDAEERVE